MRTLEITLRAEVGLFRELSRLEQDLLRAAAEARLQAQAPYSGYWVGAAVVNAAHDTLHVGCNVENVAYCGIHAEDNAITNMVCQLGPSKIQMLAFLAASASVEINLETQVYESVANRFEQIGCPCGQCLQKIWENCFNDPTVMILSRLPNGEISRAPIGSLLPVRFGPETLGIDYAKLARK
ncbi:hypothetical protein KJ611_01155 [Patescibacteria group bacterium]|nr:hypothetical protein [Patescibacteria group bacterium]MBU1705293.1 hypothetical protein [Patescibacteria group bacterium]